MVSPFKYRPEDLEDPDVTNDIEWSDNWLSNSIAWVSQFKLLEPMCNEEHYTSSKIADYFYTSCPCCLFWRSFILGVMLGIVLGFITGFLIALWALD